MTDRKIGGVAFVFPGQGSQKVGMGRDWAESFEEARATFQEADEVLGFGLSKLCWEGPEEDLILTANTQPALLTVSVAIHRVLERCGAAPSAVAGHSLGEYSALVAAGSLELADALRLVRRRGELMQEAVPAGVGAMAAIMSLDAAEVEGIAAEAAASGDEVCAVANYNAPGQTVIAGHAAAVARAMELARERGARKVVELKVSAPFHSSLMKPAREGMAELLAATPFTGPAVPVISNVDARPVGSGDEARDALIRQIDGAVRWTESIEWMAGEGGVDCYVEVGAGRVLCGLIRRIHRAAETAATDQPSMARKWLSGRGLETVAFPAKEE